MKQRLYRTLAAPVAILFLHAMLAPSLVAAQGFDFSDEEDDEYGEPMDFGDEDWGDEDFENWDDEDLQDDGWDDGWDDAVAEPIDFVDPAVVTAMIVPSETLAPALADQLTVVVMEQLGAIEGNVVVPNDGLSEQFDIMGAELAYECAFDPVCLGRYGRELGLGRIVVGRVVAGDDGTWGTTLDLFETETSSIVNYRYFETEPRTVAVQEAIPEQLRQLFGIRAERTVGGTGRTGPSTAQRAIAWTSAGLAVGAIAAGVVFGLQAKSGESDIEDCNLIDHFSGEPVCELTQQDASPIIDDARSNATLSNVMIGSGLFLGVLSVVLFTVTPGGDIDEDAVANRRWQITPSAGVGGAGLSGAVRF